MSEKKKKKDEGEFLNDSDENSEEDTVEYLDDEFESDNSKEK